MAPLGGDQPLPRKRSNRAFPFSSPLLAHEAKFPEEVADRAGISGGAGCFQKHRTQFRHRRVYFQRDEFVQETSA